MSAEPLPFAISEESYNQELVHILEPYFEPRTILQFLILLPFHVPISNEAAVMIFEDNDRGAFSYRFLTRIRREPPFPFTDLIDEGGMETPLTVVSEAYVTADSIQLEEDSKEGELTKYFDAALRYLNDILVAYSLLEKDTAVCPVTKEMLPPIIPWRVDRVGAWNAPEDGLFILHLNIPHQRKELTKDQLATVLQYAIAAGEGWNPFFLSEQVMINAERQFKSGLYREAVIDAQTSVETFLSTLFIQLLLGEGKTEADAEAERENLPYTTMLRTAFHPRLGGRWTLEDSTTSVGRYYHDTYKLRGRIVHAGYWPSFEEAARALEAAGDIRGYVISLIKRKPKKYGALRDLLTLPPGVWNR